MRTINSVADFEALMAEVDAHLQEIGAPFPGRELRVAREVALRLSHGFPMSGPFDFTPVVGCYSGPSLMGHIRRWFEGRYGGRLKVDLSIGCAAVSIRSDTWLMRMPLVRGDVRVVVERDLSKAYPNLVAYKPGSTEQLTLSVLPLLRDFPQGLANALSDAELHDIRSNFLESFEAFCFLDEHRRVSDLAMIAALDLTESAKKAAGSIDGYGMARWDALQAAEKAIKFLLTALAPVGTKNPYPTGHDGHSLSKLVALAQKHGLAPGASRLTGLVQRDSDVRYERGTHRRDDVLLAHRAATGIVCAVAHAFRKQPQQTL